MKKVIVFLLALGILCVGIKFSQADGLRTQTHKFRTFTADTAVAQGTTVYRITGVVTGASGVFGVYNAPSLGTATATVCAVEGGEATSGDALPHYNFGADGLDLPDGMTVVVNTCTVVIEYL